MHSTEPNFVVLSPEGSPALTFEWTSQVLSGVVLLLCTVLVLLCVAGVHVVIANRNVERHRTTTEWSNGQFAAATPFVTGR